ncbi:hypothetical protein ASPCAL06304 [Aspergillus calidoustus]|uniref:Uncharacterized protein n=1 Tax=Aspergillus calidoustus TaxID=454130 RepID=A0A0U5G012_ASPCI|nr:hypothetical protein ASPCAL06304 [Aspergillus calidoustus]
MSSEKSLALSNDTFFSPSQRKNEEKQPNRASESRRKRRANLYDAVAGRINSHGFIPDKPYFSQYRDTASSSNRPLPPEEVLFRRKGMPVRYEETDRYFAHESLPPDRPLPSSDLLESVHAYTSDFYDKATRGSGRADYFSMNGKSLMFMGILLEELAKESLGETGDLVLVEGEDMTDDETSSTVGRRRRKRSNSAMSIYASSGEDLESVLRWNKRSKKRRLTRRASTTDVDTEAEARR